MSGSNLCIPRSETARPRSFQNRIIMFCLPISTFMYLCAIYIFPGLVCLLCCSQMSCKNRALVPYRVILYDVLDSVGPDGDLAPGPGVSLHHGIRVKKELLILTL
jgi:hypothetical protein